MPETSHCYCLPLQPSKAYRCHSKTLVNSEGRNGCHCEIWGSRIGVNEESSLLGRKAAKRLVFSCLSMYLYINLYINNNVWVNWTDGDMQLCVGARTVLGRGTCGWSRCIGPGSVALAAHRHQHMSTRLLKIQSETCCMFLEYLFLFSLFFILIYTSKFLSLGHVFCVILPSPFFFNKNTCHSLFLTLLSSLCFMCWCVTQVRQKETEL